MAAPLDLSQLFENLNKIDPNQQGVGDQPAVEDNWQTLGGIPAGILSENYDRAGTMQSQQYDPVVQQQLEHQAVLDELARQKIENEYNAANYETALKYYGANANMLGEIVKELAGKTQTTSEKTTYGIDQKGESTREPVLDANGKPKKDAQGNTIYQKTVKSTEQKSTGPVLTDIQKAMQQVTGAVGSVPSPAPSAAPKAKEQAKADLRSRGFDVIDMIVAQGALTGQPWEKTQADAMTELEKLRKIPAGKGVKMDQKQYETALAYLHMQDPHLGVDDPLTRQENKASIDKGTGPVKLQSGNTIDMSVVPSNVKSWISKHNSVVKKLRDAGKPVPSMSQIKMELSKQGFKPEEEGIALELITQ